MILLVKGGGKTASELPTALPHSRDYFADVPAFLSKIEAVDTIKPLGRPGAYLIKHHPEGGLNYKVVMAACIQVEWDEAGMRIRPLDFDTEQVKCDYPVVKGFIESDLNLVGRGDDRIHADFQFQVSVELPIVGALMFFPQGVVKATADGIITFKCGLVVKSLFQKVLKDFELAVPVGT